MLPSITLVHFPLLPNITASWPQNWVKVKVLHLYTTLSTLASKAVYNSLTTSRELKQPWCESSPWHDWISEHPTFALNAVLPYVCWYSFYLPAEGWRAESIPGWFDAGAIIEPGTFHVKVYCSTNWAILTSITWWNSQSQGKTIIVPWPPLQSRGLSNCGWTDVLGLDLPLLKILACELISFSPAVITHLQTYAQSLVPSETGYENPLSGNGQSHKIEMQGSDGVSVTGRLFTLGGQAQIIFYLEPSKLGGIILYQLDSFPLGQVTFCKIYPDVLQPYLKHKAGIREITSFKLGHLGLS